MAARVAARVMKPAPVTPDAPFGGEHGNQDDGCVLAEV